MLYWISREKLLLWLIAVSHWIRSLSRDWERRFQFSCDSRYVTFCWEAIKEANSTLRSCSTQKLDVSCWTEQNEDTIPQKLDAIVTEQTESWKCLNYRNVGYWRETEQISQTSLFTLEKYKWWFWASVVLTLHCVLGGLSTVKDMLESSLEEERRSSYSSPQPEKVLLLWSLKIRDEALAVFYFDSFLFNSLSFLFPALFHSFLFCQTFFSPPTVAGEIQWIIDTGCIFQLLGIQFPVSVNWLVFMFSNLFLITFLFADLYSFCPPAHHFLSIFFQPCLFIVSMKGSSINPTQG